ncbi:DUF1127 domain-containing protein [Mesorhizobium sp. B2-5-9]|uniref:DUF1127 domain-containing protein n=1 Tax=Mesorhizobium sp. B2-5-9 TaxID=2589921 RepID=UPI00112CA7E6|nr:DUF1127 domain-containing protein [Mesorhizobium sp. B2-5-9]TPK20036.1 DUF1127 domain-containing protein [Mesorhizobium sp. B2-5-9]
MEDKVLDAKVPDSSIPAGWHGWHIAALPVRDGGRRMFDASVSVETRHPRIGSTGPDPSISSRGAGLLKPVRQFAAWFRHRRQIRRDIMKLLQLDDRLLADIGLSRGEILYAAVQHGRLPEQQPARLAK